MRNLLLMMLAGCAASGPPPSLPPFRGVESEVWLAYQVEQLERDDLLPAFEASARGHGCSTQQLGSESGPNIGGVRYSYHGISASCEEGTIALITLVGGRVRIGCAKPSTRGDCDLLLRKISQAR
jgi:hypothetical protein